MFIATSPDQIPPFLPVTATVLLKNWFESSTLDKGLALLKQGKISHFFIYRNSAACLCDAGTLAVFFKPTQRIATGFTIQGEHCDLCAQADSQERCAHIAALCILSLHQQADGGYAPLPMLFKQSVWGKTADFLSTWLSAEKGSTGCTRDNNLLRLHKATGQGQFQALVPTNGIIAATLLDPAGNDAVTSCICECNSTALLPPKSS